MVFIIKENTSQKRTLAEEIWYAFIQSTSHWWKTELSILNGAFNTQIYDGHGIVDTTDFVLMR